MTREQIKEQFPDATDEQISAILNINGSEVSAAKKNNIDPKELKRLQGIEVEYQKLQDADLTDAEKIQKTLKEAADAKIEFNKKLNRLDVEKILVGAGLVEDDYKDFIDGIVSDDAEKSKTLATALAGTLKKTSEAVEKRVKESLMDDTTVLGGKGKGKGDDDKPDDEKNAESISFGSVNKEAQTARDYYK